MRLVTISTVIRRAEKGITRPFLCEDDEGKQYWCKGHDAGKAALCHEWLAGRIAQDLGLPIPPFAQAEVPRELVEYSGVTGIEDLGSGTVFASEHVHGADELPLHRVSRIPPELRWKILVFDWWVQNEDRTLHETGGNVNLLWLPAVGEVRIIDHNLAFDLTFDLRKVKDKHVFRDSLQAAVDVWDLAFLDRMTDICGSVEDYWNELPEEWAAVADYSDCTLARIERVLNRFSDINDLFGSETL